MTDPERARAAEMLAGLLNRPQWQADAACQEYPPEWWFPGRGESSKPAKQVCRGCLVRDECLAYVLEHPEETADGVWAGMSRRERQMMVRTAA